MLSTSVAEKAKPACASIVLRAACPFAQLGVILLAAKKFILLVVAAIGAAIKKLFGGKDKNKPGPTLQ